MGFGEAKWGQWLEVHSKEEILKVKPVLIWAMWPQVEVSSPILGGMQAEAGPPIWEGRCGALLPPQPPFLSFSSPLTELLPHRPLCCFPATPSTSPPQGLCTWLSPLPGRFFPEILAHLSPSLQSDVCLTVISRVTHCPTTPFKVKSVCLLYVSHPSNVNSLQAGSWSHSLAASPMPRRAWHIVDVY